jgi:hypothetical protein
VLDGHDRRAVAALGTGDVEAADAEEVADALAARLVILRESGTPLPSPRTVAGRIAT